MVAAGGPSPQPRSEAGVHRWPLVSAYSVSKAAVAKLTENLAHEASPYGISVFSVHPGLLPIGMSETVMAPAPVEQTTRPHPRWVTRNYTRAAARTRRGRSS